MALVDFQTLVSQQAEQERVLRSFSRAAGQQTAAPESQASRQLKQGLGNAQKGVRQADGTVEGLPAITNKRWLSANSGPGFGATRTNTMSPLAEARLAGQPSFKLVRLSPGVAIEISRSSRLPGFIDSHDFPGWYPLGDRIIDRMEAMSHGPLGRKELREKNHPYGRGTLTPRGKRRKKLGRIGHVKGIQGSVPNMNIINSPRNRMTGIWQREVVVRNETAVLRIWTRDPRAEWLAFGTPRMRAHGPFNYAPLSYRSQIDIEFRRGVRQAYARKQMEQQILSVLGISD